MQKLWTFLFIVVFFLSSTSETIASEKISLRILSLPTVVAKGATIKEYPISFDSPRITQTDHFSPTIRQQADLMQSKSILQKNQYFSYTLVSKNELFLSANELNIDLDQPISEDDTIRLAQKTNAHFVIQVFYHESTLTQWVATNSLFLNNKYGVKVEIPVTMQVAYFDSNHQFVKHFVSKLNLKESRRVKPVKWEKEIKRTMEESLYSTLKEFFKGATLETFKYPNQKKTWQ